MLGCPESVPVGRDAVSLPDWVWRFLHVQQSGIVLGCQESVLVGRDAISLPDWVWCFLLVQQSGIVGGCESPWKALENCWKAFPWGGMRALYQAGLVFAEHDVV